MRYPKDLDRWIAKYLQDQIDKEEKNKLNAWRKNSHENERLFRQLCSDSLWRLGVKEISSFDEEEGWKSVLAKTRKHRTLRWRKWSSVAAAVLVLMGCGMLTWLKMPKAGEGISLLETKNAIRLNLASGKSFLLDSVRQIENGKTVMKNSGRQLVVETVESSKQEIEWNTIEVPRGTEYSLVLSDGTEIFLNAETVLRFPDQFKSDRKREIWLTGEAYFKVRRDTCRPFIVHSGGTEVRVLGTVFNVMAYENMPELQVTLLSGKVEVEENLNRTSVVLAPGEQAVYDKNERTLEEKVVDVSYYSAWHEGLFAFRETPLTQVMEILARWYDFEVFFQNTQARDFVYTGKIKRHATLQEVLNRFRQTREFDFEIKGKTVIIK